MIELPVDVCSVGYVEEAWENTQPMRFLCDVTGVRTVPFTHDLPAPSPSAFMLLDLVNCTARFRPASCNDHALFDRLRRYQPRFTLSLTPPEPQPRAFAPGLLVATLALVTS